MKKRLVFLELLDLIEEKLAPKYLEILTSKTKKGDILTFRDQLISEYKNKYPIYSSQEIKERISNKVLKIEELLKPFLSKNQEIPFETREDLINIFDDLFLDKKPTPLLDWFKENTVLMRFLASIIVGTISVIILRAF